MGSPGMVFAGYHVIWLYIIQQKGRRYVWGEKAIVNKPANLAGPGIGDYDERDNIVVAQEGARWREQCGCRVQDPQGAVREEKHLCSGVNKRVLLLTPSGAKALQQAGHSEAFWHHEIGGHTDGYQG